MHRTACEDETMRVSVSAKINAMREANGNPMTQCPTCTRSAGAPFRQHDQWGHVVLGCVDAFHEGHLVTPSASADWHRNGEPLRRAEWNRLKS